MLYNYVDSNPVTSVDPVGLNKKNTAFQAIQLWRTINRPEWALEQGAKLGIGIQINLLDKYLSRRELENLINLLNAADWVNSRIERQSLRKTALDAIVRRTRVNNCPVERSIRNQQADEIERLLNLEKHVPWSEYLFREWFM